MALTFTDREFRLLLELAQMSETVFSDLPPELRTSLEPYELLIQKLFSHAAEMDCADLVVPDRETNRYVATTQLTEATANQLLDERDSEGFWNRLTDYLSLRDLQASAGRAQVATMSFDQYREAVEPYYEKYEVEWESNGIERLEVVEK